MSASPLAHGPETELLKRLAASGLRGRGGGWFPAARKWQAVRVEGGASLIVANGAEGEPGSVKDRHLMASRADDILDGLDLAAQTLGAPEAVIYLKGSFEGPAASLRAAVARRPSSGLRVSVVQGSETYVGGEETAVLEVLEGRRAWPRPKPPLPAAVGFRGAPTLVQNVETLARVPAALRDPEGYRASETTLVSLWGHVRRPGVYEVRLGRPLSSVIDAEGGGAPDGVGMVFPAGPSATPLGPAQLDLPLDPDALRAAGSALGTAAVLIVRSGACPLSVAGSVAGFFEREACGQCPPCVLGTAGLARVLRAVEAGRARPADLQHLAEVAGFMSMHGYCAHSRTAAGVATGLLQRFRSDLEAHLGRAGCPRGAAGACAPFDVGSPERAAIEATVA
jgi:NADH:ubiquinone oxidoreductase subunit F (NADH-binding)